MKKWILCSAVLMLLISLTGCGGIQQEKVVEVTLPEEAAEEENGSGTVASDISIYEYEVALDEESRTQLKNLREYRKAAEEYDAGWLDLGDIFARNGLAQAGFSGEDVWLSCRTAEGTVTARTLDMEYGFYETLWEEELKTGTEKIWVSPDGTKRLILHESEEEARVCLDWVDAEGETCRILTGESGWDGEAWWGLQCVWSGDSSRVFLRLCPSIYFPESWGEWDADDEENYSCWDEYADSALFTPSSPCEIWMLEGDTADLAATCVFDTSASDQLWRPQMVVSWDGSAVFQTMSGGDAAVMELMNQWPEQTASVYLWEEDGVWSSVRNEDWAMDEEGDLTGEDLVSVSRDACLWEDLVGVLNYEGEYLLWDTASGTTQNLGKMHGPDLKRFIYFCVEDTGEERIYAVSDSDLYYMEYGEDGNWEMISVYRGPSDADLVDITVQPETGDILLNYLLGGLEAADGETLEMQLVLLTF
ncbi:MAG: hypothetical protein LUC27_04335 [Lachnospiraceae bacterium]|nr:hypothetical protein [Lachnospiraceae bacterium]